MSTLARIHSEGASLAIGGHLYAVAARAPFPVSSFLFHRAKVFLAAPRLSERQLEILLTLSHRHSGNPRFSEFVHRLAFQQKTAPPAPPILQ